MLFLICHLHSFSTLLGSSTLASALGGIFVTTTPVGWVIGSAVVAGTIGYGLTKMIRSGSEQDKIRKDIIERLNNRLQVLQQQLSDTVIELNQISTLAIASDLISEEQANKMVELIEKGLLTPEIALHRLKTMALSARIIESLPEESG